MTEKNVVKLLIGLGVPAEKHADIITKAEAEDFDVADLLEYAKKFAEPLIKPGIEKAARTEGASGAIKKVLKAVYDSVKDDTTPAFEEWLKLPEIKKDYADVVSDSIAASKLKGVSGEEAVKELNTKLSAALKANGVTVKEKEVIIAEYEQKLAAKDFEVVWDKTIKGLEKKPLKDASYKYFKADLADEGIEARLHEGKIALFKKGETAPLQNEKGTAFVTLEEKFNNWAAENAGQFVNSAGNGGANGGVPDVKGSKMSEDGKTIILPGHLPVPVLE